MSRRREELRRAGVDPERIGLEPDMFEKQARRQVALGLLVAEIVKEHRIEPEPERVRARIETIASTYQEPEKLVEWYYASRERLSDVESLVVEDQVVDWILERARVTEEPASFDRILNPGQTGSVAA